MKDEEIKKGLSLLEKTEFYDDEGEWRIADSDWVLMSGSALRSWIKVTEQILGSESKAIMYKGGVRAGEQFAKILQKKGLKNEELKYALETFFTNGGWGKVKAKVNFQEQTGIVRIRNSVTARETKAEEPACHFISGYIAGALSVIFGKRIECVETRCKAMGDSFCEFRASDPSKLKNTNHEGGS